MLCLIEVFHQVISHIDCKGKIYAKEKTGYDQISDIREIAAECFDNLERKENHPQRNCKSCAAYDEPPAFMVDLKDLFHLHIGEHVHPLPARGEDELGVVIQTTINAANTAAGSGLHDASCSSVMLH